MLAAGAFFALAFRPEPFSDWFYYWRAAGDLSLYERGGAALLLVGALRPLNAPPYALMLCLNLIAAVAILLAARRLDGSAGKFFSHFVAAYLLLIAPYYALVQFDLLAAMCIALGWVLLLRPPAHWPPAATLGVSVVLFGMAVSTRPQFLLVLTPFAVLWLASQALRRQALPALRSAAALVLGAALGFASDSALRAQAGHSGAVRTTSAVTLYSGLLASSASPRDCGRWTDAATAAMRSDLQVSLPHAIGARIAAQPASHWWAVLRCKSKRIVLPEAFAWYWLTASPHAQDVWRDVQAAAPGLGPAIARVEFGLYRALTLALYAVAVLAVFRFARTRESALLPALWLASFWLVHSIFEIQGRYFLAALLLLPLLCAAAWPEKGKEAAGGMGSC